MPDICLSPQQASAISIVHIHLSQVSPSASLSCLWVLQNEVTQKEETRGVQQDQGACTENLEMQIWVSGFLLPLI